MTGAGMHATDDRSAQRPDISVCVAVWKRHRPPHVGTLSASLEAALDGLRAELIVTLNGIDPKRVPLPEDATTVEFPVNRGVSIAWNAAAARASGDVLCFINDDAVVGPQALRQMWEPLMTHPEAGAVGPVGTRWDVARFHHIKYLDTSALPVGTLCECEVLSGFCFATRREVFEQAGGFDEAYTPCGAEEVDYCTTVRTDLGLTCYAVAGIEHHHVCAISAARPWRRVSYDGRSESVGSIAARNRRYFLEKWTDKLATTAGAVVNEVGKHPA